MAFDISQLQVDLKQNRALVSLNKQGTPITPNDFESATVTFPVADNDQQREGMTEASLRQRAKQVLLDAANSL